MSAVPTLPEGFEQHDVRCNGARVRVTVGGAGDPTLQKRFVLDRRLVDQHGGAVSLGTCSIVCASASRMPLLG